MKFDISILFSSLKNKRTQPLQKYKRGMRPSQMLARLRNIKIANSILREIISSSIKGEATT